MEINGDLQETLDRVYQKTLMCVPEEVTSIMDGLTRQFINDFIRVFRGSSLGNVQLNDVDDEQARQKVISLFQEIQEDLRNTRVNYADMSSLSSDLHTLRMYIDGREDWGHRVQNALYNVRNMADTNEEAADVLRQASEKYQATEAFQKPTNEIYHDKKREDIRQYFLDNGIIEEIEDDDGDKVDEIVADAMTQRPSEVEKLMTILFPLVEQAQAANQMDDCLWAANLAKSGALIAKSLKADGVDITPPNPIGLAADECRKVYRLCSSTYKFLEANLNKDDTTSLEYLADPYMKTFLYDMINAGKVSKDKDNSIQIEDIDSITPEDIISLYKKVKTALFRLGPDNSDEDTVVQFADEYDRNIKILKSYIDFILSDELNPVVSKETAAANDAKANGKPASKISIKVARKNLVGAYILITAVHDTFNGCIMRYEKETVVIDEERTIPSYDSFNANIYKKCDKASGEFPGFDISASDIFNLRVMFSTRKPYFPFEFVIYEHPNLYTRMCQYRRGYMQHTAANAMNKCIQDNKQVQHIFDDFAQDFNEDMGGVARIDPKTEKLNVSSLINVPSFAEVFNKISSGIVYSTERDVNDKETEYKLWAMLKQLADNPPETLPKEAKHEFINAAHTLEDIRFRLELAISAGVVSSDKKGMHFSGYFGKVENGRNIQAQRTRQVMNILLKFVNGLLFTNTNEALYSVGYKRPMNMQLVLPYLRLIRDIAVEYNVAVKRNNATALGFACDASTQIIAAVNMYDGE